MKGMQAFAALCQELIDGDESLHWLNPDIVRTRSTDWVATIFSHHDDDCRVKLAQGQAPTLDEACQRCVDDYHERKADLARKRELLQAPIVQEAFKRFGVNVDMEGIDL